MSHDTTAPKRRIGGGTSIAMVAVALVLDFAVVIMLVGGTVIAFSTLSGDSCVEAGTGLASNLEEGRNPDRGFWYKWLVTGPDWMNGWGNVRLGTVANGVRCVGSGGLALAGAWFTFPIMAAMVSAIAGVLSVLIFTVWFAALRVHVMGLSYRRAMINLTTMVIESIPILNLFPMQTVAVILHIRITHKEDDRKIKEWRKKHGANRQAMEARRRQEYAVWEESAAVAA